MNENLQGEELPVGHKKTMSMRHVLRPYGKGTLIAEEALFVSDRQMEDRYHKNDKHNKGALAPVSPCYFPDRAAGARKIGNIEFDFAPYRNELDILGTKRNKGYEVEFDLCVEVLVRDLRCTCISADSKRGHDALLTAPGSMIFKPKNQEKRELTTVHINIAASFDRAKH